MPEEDEAHRRQRQEHCGDDRADQAAAAAGEADPADDDGRDAAESLTGR
jgi:hypothetical protein